MNTSHMEEFDVIENYLWHGDYPIGTAKDQTCEEKCRNNCTFDKGILYYWKKTDTLI